MKIPDGMIKILPDWGYDWASREHFLTMFKRMLKSIGAVFLVQNERREYVPPVGLETSFSAVGKQPEVGQVRFFSPSQDRQMAAQARYGDDRNARDGGATYPHFGAEQASVGTRMQPKLLVHLPSEGV